MQQPAPDRRAFGGGGAGWGAPRPSRPRLRIGCLGVLLLGLLGLVAFELLFNPWAFHLGNRLTPLTEWEGVGVLQTSGGARDAIYLRLWLASRGMTSSSSRGRSTFEGQALIRTPQGETLPYRVNGYLSTTWWSADGVPLSLRLRTPKGASPRQLFDLYGAFRGAQLVLDDHGSSGRLLRPDGSVDPLGWQRHSTADHSWVRVTLEWGTRDDFEALARRLAAGR